MPKTQKNAPEQLQNPYVDKKFYKTFCTLVGILIIVALIGFSIDEENRAWYWLYILLLMVSFSVVLGKGITGSWRGILIDSRNKLSLSRLQMLSWTAIVLSTILAASLSNVYYGWDSPLSFKVPTELWIAMGISTVSLVASPAILSTKIEREPDPEVKKTVNETDGEKKAEGLVVINLDPRDARWSDLVLGEEAANFRHVDLGKMQMLLISFVLLMSYVAALWSMFSEPGVVTTLPKVSEGMNVLLGISHTGYLSSKAMTHTREASNS